MKKYVVDIREVSRLMNILDDINKMTLSEIEFRDYGRVIEVSKEDIENWNYTGLSNTWFVRDVLC